MFLLLKHLKSRLQKVNQTELAEWMGKWQTFILKLLNIHVMTPHIQLVHFHIF